MLSSSSIDDGLRETSESSTSTGDTRTSSPCAQRQNLLPTWPRTENSPTLVPSLPGAQKQLQVNFSNWQRLLPNPSTGSPAPKRACLISTHNDSDPWPPARPERPLPNGPGQTPGSGRTYNAYPYRRQNQSAWLARQDAAKLRGPNGNVQNLRCGCVILTCYDHSGRNITNQSCSTTCPLVTCQSPRKST